jgi:hypothetical protein
MAALYEVYCSKVQKGRRRTAAYANLS